MKLKRINRWKLKQKKFNQKYKLKSLKKSSKSQDYKGKVLFLMSGRNLLTILKFITKNSCTTEEALLVDDNFIKRLSKKVLVTSKRYKKLMKNCEVMVTKDYKDSLMKLINITNSSQMNAPSCEICHAIFINETTLQKHIQEVHKMESENETGSEVEIGEEEEDEEFLPLQPNVIIKEYNTSLNSTNPSTSHDLPSAWTFIREEQKPKFKCRICSLLLTERGFLNRHIIGLHIPNVYRCYKCKVVYEQKQRLVNHLTMAHIQNANEEKFKATLCDPEDFSVFHCSFCKYSCQEREPVAEHMLAEHYEDFDMESADESSRPSTPDSLEELLLPENRARLFGYSSTPTERSASPPSKLPFRCARCKRQFQRKYLLKDHLCLERPNDDDEPPVKLLKSNAVNGFYHCTFPRCSQVYTNKVLFETHLAIDHSQPKMK